MAKKNLGVSQVILECTEARKIGRPDLVSRYHTWKNRKKKQGKMELRKYNPNLGRHTIHREISK